MAAPTPGALVAAAPAAPATTTTLSKGLSLLVAAVHNHKEIYRVDLKLVDAATGAIVGKMDGQRTGKLMATGGLICHVPIDDWTTLRVLNPATGATVHIPSGSTETADGRPTTWSTYVLGQVPNTVEYKVLRIYGPRGSYNKPNQLCEILTLDGHGDHMIWRPVSTPPVAPPVDTSIPRHRTVAKGIAHFLMEWHWLPISRVGKYNGIASFDLAKEEWMPSLLATPIAAEDRNCNHDNLSLVELNDCLVFVYHDRINYSLVLWMLEDLAKGKWVKMETIEFAWVMRGWDGPDKPQPITKSMPIGHRLSFTEIFALPLMVLGDGCIVFWVQIPFGMVRVYDPKTHTSKDVVKMGNISSFVGKYKSGQVGFML